MIIDKILVSKTRPNRTDVGWAKPLSEGGFALYFYFNGRWQPQKPVDDQGSFIPEDDKPWDGRGDGKTVGPDTVDSDAIIDGSIGMSDLNEEVANKLEDTYVGGDEALYINGTKP